MSEHVKASVNELAVSSATLIVATETCSSVLYLQLPECFHLCRPMLCRLRRSPLLLLSPCTAALPAVLPVVLPAGTLSASQPPSLPSSSVTQLRWHCQQQQQHCQMAKRQMPLTSTAAGSQQIWACSTPQWLIRSGTWPHRCCSVALQSRLGIRPVLEMAVGMAECVVGLQQGLVLVATCHTSWLTSRVAVV